MDSIVWVEVPIEEWKKTGTEQYYGTVNKFGVIQQSYYKEKEGEFYTLGISSKELFKPNLNITHVLVKKPLPTEEEIRDYFKESCDDPNNGIDDTCYSKRDGAKWLRDKLLNKLYEKSTYNRN